MKKILVTGENGAVSKAFKGYLSDNFKEKYTVELLSLRKESWKQTDFSKYDVVYHCAGIVKSDLEGYSEFEKINVDLTKALFEFASQQGVRQFIYLSSMAVYGTLGSDCKHGGIINENTVPTGPTLYGKSKLDAENILKNANTATKIAIIRAPSIVGKGTENYFAMHDRLLSLPVFPLMFNECKKSILYIDCLSELVRLIIDNEEEGVFFPQNKPALSISEMLKEIKKIKGTKTILLPIPKFLQFRFKKLNSIFGNVCYTDQLSNCFDNEYSIIDTKDAINRAIINI